MKKFKLVGLGGMSQFCEFCGNDFEKHPGGVVLWDLDTLESYNICSRHVDKKIRLGDIVSMDDLDEISKEVILETWRISLKGQFQ